MVDRLLGLLAPDEVVGLELLPYGGGIVLECAIYHAAQLQLLVQQVMRPEASVSCLLHGGEELVWDTDSYVRIPIVLVQVQ